MIKPAMISVRHTGSHWLCSVFRKLYGKDFTTANLLHDEMPKEVDLLWCHIDDYAEPMERHLKDRAIIVPLRDPLLCLCSHKRDGGESQTFEFVAQCYANLFDYLNPFNPLYIPVDLCLANPELRRPALQTLSDRLEVEDEEILLSMEKGWDRNSGDIYPLKLAYYTKDWDTLKSKMPTEIESLKKLKDNIYPHLETLGYSWPKQL